MRDELNIYGDEETKREIEMCIHSSVCMRLRCIYSWVANDTMPGPGPSWSVPLSLYIYSFRVFCCFSNQHGTKSLHLYRVRCVCVLFYQMQHIASHRFSLYAWPTSISAENYKQAIRTTIFCDKWKCQQREQHRTKYIIVFDAFVAEHFCWWIRFDSSEKSQPNINRLLSFSWRRRRRWDFGMKKFKHFCSYPMGIPQKKIIFIDGQRIIPCTFEKMHQHLTLGAAAVAESVAAAVSYLYPLWEFSFFSFFVFNRFVSRMKSIGGNCMNAHAVSIPH